jgi:anti-sigma factor RsiW
MTMDRHEPFEELISASLAGDITDDERRRLDAHLDSCARCRDTLRAFADQRRIIAGLRQVAPPRDLGARVRGGIEAGAFVPLPWWRRPAVILATVGGGLAAVAGVLLALVVLGALPDQSAVGNSPTPSASLSAAPSASVVASATPVPASPSVAPSASAAPTPTPAPTVQPSPEPDAYLALTGPFDNLLLTARDGATGETLVEAETVPPGGPTEGELSPDGDWFAYGTPFGQKGTWEVFATRIGEASGRDTPVAIGATAISIEGQDGGSFLQHMAWSPDGRYLAFTVSGLGDGSVDAFVFDPSTGVTTRLTDVGSAYAGSWVENPDQPGTYDLWVSVAGPEPVSYLVPVVDDRGAPLEDVDPAATALSTLDGVFQPIVSPNGAFVIYWRGTMAQSGADWTLAEGGAPYLAEHRWEAGGTAGFESERQLFADLTIGRSAFASGAVAWGPDSDAYAFWDLEWTGTSQGSNGVEYPDPERVYFSHATDARGITQTHALDAGDIPAGTRVVDVAIAPTGRHLAITAARPSAGLMDPPHADLLLVTRNTGSQADEVRVLGSGADGGGWYGPAGYVLRGGPAE